MSKKIVKVITVLILVGALFGAFDFAMPAFGVSAAPGEVVGFGVLPAVSAQGTCPDGSSGCDD